MRSRSVRSSSAMLTGFISLEEVDPSAISSAPSPPFSPPSSSSSSSSPKRTRRRAVLGALQLRRPQWVYAVLHQGRLRCYARRADIKLNREPRRVLLLDLEATRVGERQSLLLRSRATGKTLRLRVHASSATTFLQWLTALYLARLDASGTTATGSNHGSEKTATAAKRRVTFHEVVVASERHGTQEEEEEEDGSPRCRETVDLGELFYSKADLAGFRAAHHTRQQREKAPLRAGRRFVRSLVAKLRRRHSDDEEQEDDHEEDPLAE